MKSSLEAYYSTLGVPTATLLVQQELDLLEIAMNNAIRANIYFVVHNATIIGNPSLSDASGEVEPGILTKDQRTFHAIMVSNGYDVSKDNLTGYWQIGWEAGNQTVPPTATGARSVIAGIAPTSPQGKLTIVSNTPVMVADQSGSTLYYTPFVGKHIPLYDGSEFIMNSFGELTNVLSESSAYKSGPAAVGTYELHDFFVWRDPQGGDMRLTRGPKWTSSATITMTIATPGVVTWTAHGLWTGATIRFTTTGALPTGITANTVYFVTKVDANTLRLSTSLANVIATTYIATSGTQSGVHTGLNYTSARGTGEGTTQLLKIDGHYVNKYAITNGPEAECGTYVGSCHTNVSSLCEFKFGGGTLRGTGTILGLWNSYNRIETDLTNYLDMGILYP